MVSANFLETWWVGAQNIFFLARIELDCRVGSSMNVLHLRHFHPRLNFFLFLPRHSFSPHLLLTSSSILQPPPDFQLFCLCFPPSPLINVAVPQKVAESRVASRSPTFFKATLTRGEGGMKKSFFSRWLNNFVSDCLKMQHL